MKRFCGLATEGKYHERMENFCLLNKNQFLLDMTDNKVYKNSKGKVSQWCWWQMNIKEKDEERNVLS